MKLKLRIIYHLFLRIPQESNPCEVTCIRFFVLCKLRLCFLVIFYCKHPRKEPTFLQASLGSCAMNTMDRLFKMWSNLTIFEACRFLQTSADSIVLQTRADFVIQ